MRYLAVFLKFDGRPCVVVGGGDAAERKARALLEAGARVTLIGAALTATLGAMAKAGTIAHRCRDFQPADLDGAALVYVATDDLTLSAAVAAEARRRAIPVNVADAPELCSFIAPAVVQRGALQIAISTSGASPALARRLRAELENRFGPEYGPALEIMRAARCLLREREPDAKARARRLNALAESDLVDCLARGEWARADRLATEHVGAGLVELGINPALFNVEHSDGDRPAR
jgi:precorrin-2 dehydrogenase/sirohydrochlorin ferrochelatase